MQLRILVAAGAAALAVSTSSPAEDGVFGPSTAHLAVALAKPEATADGALPEVTLENRDGASHACVFGTTGRYAVTATSANSSDGRDFRFQGGYARAIPYQLRWKSETGVEVLTGGEPLAGRTARVSPEDCDGTVPAGLIVRVSQAARRAAYDGYYADTLTVILAAE